jgi:hypothetical protein
MSLKHNKNVPELVKNYRSKYPNVDRDLLRKLIRLENKIENPSELKKLDRCLRKSFIGLKSATLIKTESDKIVKPGWLERRSERKRQEMEIERKERLVAHWTSMEQLAKSGGAYTIFKDIADMEKRNRKELGLD